MSANCSPLDRLPDELLLRIISNLDSHTILRNVLPSCRHLRTLCRDNMLWDTICATELAFSHGHSQKFERAKWLGTSETDPSGVVLAFWMNFVRQWQPRLGWWADIRGMRGQVYYIAADFDGGQIKCMRFEPYNHFNSRVGVELLPHSIRSTMDDQSSMYSIDSYAYGQLSISILDERCSLVIDKVGRYDVEEQREVTIRDGQVEEQLSTGDVRLAIARASNAQEERSSFVSPLWASRNYLAPALFPAFDTRADEDAAQELALLLRYNFEQDVVRLRALESYVDDRTLPFRPGWYIGSYGPHGCELIFIHFVNSTNSPQEPLHDRLPTEVLGLRVEAVKITGDPNIPKGIRTFVGFLGSTETRYGPGGVPDHTSRPVWASWPVDENSVRAALAAQADGREALVVAMDDVYASPTGVTMPGLGRIAAHMFNDPKWTETIVHVSARDEIQVMWTRMRLVATYRRVRDSIQH
ncbi:hypothetical protein BKA62DRAFT_662976 [Auriculariales sp. MPI-PUGE-AT-0066]|nr:hypothetical protein BKA62DRAFT_662976 [Auriculariales sp. MPI-PUGE-AT-0066]